MVYQINHIDGELVIVEVDRVGRSTPLEDIPESWQKMLQALKKTDYDVKIFARGRK